jgi:hypothetical protein
MTNEQFRVLEEELKIVIEELMPLLDEIASHTASTPLDPEKARELLRRVEEMLENRNPECMNLIDDVRAVSGSGELVRHIEEFEFKEAVQALKTLKKTLGERENDKR